MWFLVWARGQPDKHTDKQTDVHGHHNTPLLYIRKTNYSQTAVVYSVNNCRYDTEENAYYFSCRMTSQAHTQRCVAAWDYTGWFLSYSHLTRYFKEFMTTPFLLWLKPHIWKCFENDGRRTTENALWEKLNTKEKCVKYKCTYAVRLQWCIALPQKP